MIKRKKQVHYNQTRREFFLALAKIVAPLAFVLFGSLDVIIYIGAGAAVAMFLFSFNFRSQQKVATYPANNQ
ncbi:MAG: hypothetical protein WC292_00665 [Clostridia bacterium]